MDAKMAKRVTADNKTTFNAELLARATTHIKSAAKQGLYECEFENDCDMESRLYLVDKLKALGFKADWDRPLDDIHNMPTIFHIGWGEETVI